MKKSLAGWVISHTVWVTTHTAMKMTMNIDEDVLTEVMEITGAKTKTAAVEMALTEMARRRKLGKALRELAEIPGEEMAAGYDFTAADAREKVVYRFPEGNSGRVAEGPIP
jgi:Arc/MetJ family transcription regulator